VGSSAKQKGFRLPLGGGRRKKPAEEKIGGGAGHSPPWDVWEAASTITSDWGCSKAMGKGGKPREKPDQLVTIEENKGREIAGVSRNISFEAQWGKGREKDQGESSQGNPNGLIKTKKGGETG